MVQTGNHRLASRSALLAVAFGIAWSVPARPEPDYRASFRTGVQAYERKRYKETADAMRRALDLHPQEGSEEIKITGSWVQAYVPHFFLGAALYGQGDCPGALREWQESERQGFAGYGSDEREVVMAHRAACLGPLLEERSRSADAELDQAERERQSILQLEATQFFRDALSDPVLQKREQGALKALASARERTHGAKTARDPDALAQAQELARQAGLELRAVKEQAAERVRQISAAGKGTAGPLGAATGAPAPAEPVPTEVAEAPKARQLAPPSFPAKPAPQTPPPGPSPPRQPPGQAGERQAAPSVPTQLREGIRAYFEGRYAEALRTLAVARFPAPSIQAEAALFAAASRMAQYWLSGMRDQKLLDAARRDVATCKRLDGKLTPDLRVFSPRFVSFFASPDLAGGGGLL